MKKYYINKLFRFVYDLDSIVQLVCLPLSFEESMVTIHPPPPQKQIWPHVNIIF